MQAWRTTLFTIKGLRRFLKDGFEYHEKSYDAADLAADMTGKHAIVTGANQGLGFSTASELAKRGATVHLVCRSADRGAAAVTAIREATGSSSVHLTVADLSCTAQAARVADDYIASGAPLHLLVNNAGALIDPRTLTSEGVEANFAINTLACFVLTERLLPLLRSSAPSRAIVVSSGGQYTEELHTKEMQWGTEGGFSGARQYARDKRRQTALTEYWAAQPQNAGVIFVSMHPGWADTDAVRTSLPQFYESLKPRLRTPAQGADTLVWLSVVDAAKLKSGEFYFDRRPASKHLNMGGTGYEPERAAELAHRLREEVAAIRARQEAAAKQASS
jgi:dehydrogenase/reductase SDR family protein 12